ncbi:MAG: hypothetical protein NTX24_02010 [Candidatus Pacearchaeota archaeon]|nr:hypothetical protein [Candidatus Pacearchaeota archaeon]
MANDLGKKVLRIAWGAACLGSLIIGNSNMNKATQIGPEYSQLGRERSYALGFCAEAIGIWGAFCLGAYHEYNSRRPKKRDKQDN